jgi:hypothetical protein
MSLLILDRDRNRSTNNATTMSREPRSFLEMEDNQSVRRLLAATLVVLFASLNAVDGVCCPDGCTHKPASTSQHNDRQSPEGSCLLCLGGVESAVPQNPSAAGIVTDRITPLVLTRHLDAPTEPADHPPRP